MFHKFGRSAFANNFSSMLSGSGTYIYHMICSFDHIFIMFNHYDGVTNIPQRFQRINQLFIISLMQTNTWFIKNIEHTHQLGTNLSSQANTLGFTTRERFRTTVEVKIGKTYVQQKLKTSSNLLNYFFCYLQLLFRKVLFDSFKPFK